jgi:hypothetical protein
MRNGTAWEHAGGWDLREEDGWILGRRAVRDPQADGEAQAGGGALAVHADWRGPFKLARSRAPGRGHPGRGRGGGRGGLEERFECYVPRGLDAAGRVVDEDARREREEALRSLLSLLGPEGERAPRRDPGAQPGAAPGARPAPEELASWLRADDRDVAVDERGDLRLVIKRPDADGQVRIERTGESLRLSLSLGSWENVAPDARRAMLALAEEANARTRLARIVWKEEKKEEKGSSTAGESRLQILAACDLSGLPASGEVGEAFLRGMLGMSLAALELSLRRLGLELQALALPEGRELSHWLLLEESSAV